MFFMNLDQPERETRFVKSPVTDLYYLLGLEKIMGYDLNRGENVTS